MMRNFGMIYQDNAFFIDDSEIELSGNSFGGGDGQHQQWFDHDNDDNGNNNNNNQDEETMDTWKIDKDISTAVRRAMKKIKRQEKKAAKGKRKMVDLNNNNNDDDDDDGQMDDRIKGVGAGAGGFDPGSVVDADDPATSAAAVSVSATTTTTTDLPQRKKQKQQRQTVSTGRINNELTATQKTSSTSNPSLPPPPPTITRTTNTTTNMIPTSTTRFSDAEKIAALSMMGMMSTSTSTSASPAPASVVVMPPATSNVSTSNDKVVAKTAPKSTTTTAITTTIAAAVASEAVSSERKENTQERKSSFSMPSSSATSLSPAQGGTSMATNKQRVEKVNTEFPDAAGAAVANARTLIPPPLSTKSHEKKTTATVAGVAATKANEPTPNVEKTTALGAKPDEKKTTTIISSLSMRRSTSRSTAGKTRRYSDFKETSTITPATTTTPAATTTPAPTIPRVQSRKKTSQSNPPPSDKKAPTKSGPVWLERFDLDRSTVDPNLMVSLVKSNAASGSLVRSNAASGVNLDRSTVDLNLIASLVKLNAESVTKATSDANPKKKSSADTSTTKSGITIKNLPYYARNFKFLDDAKHNINGKISDIENRLLQQPKKTEERKELELHTFHQHIATGRFKKYKRLVLKIGINPVRKKHIKDENGWELYNLMHDLSNPYQDTPSDRQKIQSFKDTFSKTHTIYLTNLLKLLQFKQKHGHCNVPNKWEEDYLFSRWVIRQRYHKKLFFSGKSAQFSFERCLILDQWDFAWDLREDSWDVNFEQVAKKVNAQEKKDVVVHTLFNKSSKLRQWLEHQNQLFRHLLSGGATTLSPDQVKKLNDIGFKFTCSSRTGVDIAIYRYATKISGLSNQKKDKWQLTPSPGLAKDYPSVYESITGAVATGQMPSKSHEEDETTQDD